MNFREAFLSAVGHLGTQKLRSVLTMLGVVFGVGAVIAMLSIGAGAERQALEMIERLGLSNILVRAKEMKDDEAREVRAKSLGVSLRDCEAIRDAVPGVELVAPKVEVDPYTVLAADTSGVGAVAAQADDALVFGVSHQHARLTGLELTEGRFLDALDEQQHAQVAVIGERVRQALFGYGSAVGRDVKVDDVWFRVVGVLAGGGGEADSFQGVALSSTADAIYLPVTTVLRKYDRSVLESPLTEIVIRLTPGTSSRGVARAVKALLDQLHGGQEDYELVVPEALLEQSQRTQRLFNIVMGCIAGISLLVGGIGIMNIMLATVLERTREIGVRRAVGAKKRDILFQFMVESFTISVFGGIAGIVMGVAIAQVIAASAGWPTVVTLSSILLATGVAVTVGISSGLYPAMRAAELDPIESLRYD
jgi:putative ABC transport system permease protein